MKYLHYGDERMSDWVATEAEGLDFNTTRRAFKWLMDNELITQHQIDTKIAINRTSGYKPDEEYEVYVRYDLNPVEQGTLIGVFQTYWAVLKKML